MKVVTIIGARPQFVKAAAISREFQKYNNINEIVLHTGQHFDSNMSEIFFEQMKIPKPDYNLNVNRMGHGAMTGRMLEGIEQVLIEQKPDWVLVYGDTNSTIAGALAAKKLHIKVAHVEAGLRSFNMNMPEEINRILTDRISDILFCPTQTAMKNLEKEGFDNFQCKKLLSGDVMQDVAMFYSNLSQKPDIDLPEKFILSTIHREENTTVPERFTNILKAINDISKTIKVVLPIHPGTKEKIKNFDKGLYNNIILIDPVGYLEMVYLLQNCEMVMTDSGGLQKEAFFFGKKCITLRDETEWVELIENGYNVLAGADYNIILDKYNEMKLRKPDFNKNLYGNGKASENIVKALMS
ncbi:MAG: UDP-N-acetylglucosamine 2-epimerase (non-hydrolyzing) [Marinilabiliales bacterium]